MGLAASGTISLGGSTTGRSVNLELKKSATAVCSLNDTAVRSLAKKSSGVISLHDLHGKSSIPPGDRYTVGIGKSQYGSFGFSIVLMGTNYGSCTPDRLRVHTGFSYLLIRSMYSLPATMGFVLMGNLEKIIPDSIIKSLYWDGKLCSRTTTHNINGQRSWHMTPAGHVPLTQADVGTSKFMYILQ